MKRSKATSTAANLKFDVRVFDVLLIHQITHIIVSIVLKIMNPQKKLVASYYY